MIAPYVNVNCAALGEIPKVVVLATVTGLISVKAGFPPNKGARVYGPDGGLPVLVALPVTLALVGCPQLLVIVTGIPTLFPARKQKTELLDPSVMVSAFEVA